MKLRYLLSIWKTFRIPSLMSVMSDWKSFVRMNFIYAALDTGLLDALRQPASREALIAQLKVQRPELLDALLDVGLSLGEIILENDLYQIRGRRSKAVVGSDGDMLAALIQAHVTYYGEAYRKAGSRIRGKELGEDLDDIGALVARFSKIGEPLLDEFLSQIIAGSKPMRILDVGCGSGVFLKCASEANANACGIGVEMDRAAMDQARQNMIDWKLDRKFKILGEDFRFLVDTLSERFDLITLFNLLYYFKEDERLPLLSKIGSMLKPGGRVAVAMNCRSQGKDLAAANLNLVNCSLKGLTALPYLRDLKGLLESSGFTDIRVHRLMPSSTFYGLTAGVSEIS